MDIETEIKNPIKFGDSVVPEAPVFQRYHYQEAIRPFIYDRQADPVITKQSVPFFTSPSRFNHIGGRQYQKDLQRNFQTQFNQYYLPFNPSTGVRMNRNNEETLLSRM
jgi:hypothetical protein